MISFARSCFVLCLVVSLSGTHDAHAYQQKDIPGAGTGTFRAYHPDVKFRLDGLVSYKAGRFTEAMRRFRWASRYGDKPSQAMISEMYRLGQGVPVDPVLAYAWMDLAAERGYTSMLVQRERLWSALDGAQRVAAVELGGGLYEEYGDAVARPRMAKMLQRARLYVTGSRAGFVNNIQVGWPPGSELWYLTRGEQIYARELWRAEDYFQWQDRTWQSAGTGNVEVGPMEPVKQEPSGP